MRGLGNERGELSAEGFPAIRSVDESERPGSEENGCSDQGDKSNRESLHSKSLYRWGGKMGRLNRFCPKPIKRKAIRHRTLGCGIL